MCGIIAWYNASASSEKRDQVLRKMQDVLKHRGPDGHGVWHHPTGLSLAHTRLAIVELSPLGAQPMHSKNDQWAITFNGEIYNFRDLRHELFSEGVAFVGQSDTEVLLEGISKWGVELTLKRCVGQFAFAAFDKKNLELTIARDRMGEKPLYYWIQNHQIAIASELKALKLTPHFQSDLDMDSISLFLQHGYIPAPQSIYRGVKKLRPGHFLKMSLAENQFERGSPESQPYWNLDAHVCQPRLDISAEEAIEQLELVLRRAIRDQMLTDVPLGAFLSGGIDSSTIVALMQAQSSRPVRTFSIGFSEKQYDEAPFAKKVAAHLQTDHTELYVSPEEALKVIPELPEIYDEPFADSSQIPTQLVARLARQHVTVSLSGDAGDELFGGYSRYFMGDSLWRKLAKIPRSARYAGASAALSLSPKTWDHLARATQPLLPSRFRIPHFGDRMHKFANVATSASSSDFYRQLIRHWQNPQDLLPQLTTVPDLLSPFTPTPCPLTFIEEMMRFDSLTYLPGDILTKVDRAAMSVSLETRVPFLDHRVVELAWQLPLKFKVQGTTGKWIIRQILSRFVPPALFERPKSGFAIPLDSWLRGPLRPWAENLLSKEALERDNIFASDEIRKCWSEHLSGRRNWQYHLWNILMFQAWRSNNGL